MIKKNLWIVALIAIFAITFMGCPDGGFGGDPKGSAGAAEGELIVDDADEIGDLLSAIGYYGDATGGLSADGNTAKFAIPQTGSSDNFGFLLKFPEEAVGYSQLKVTFKVSGINLPGGGKAKIGFKSAKGTGDVIPYAQHELVFSGTEGEELIQAFSLTSPNKLPNNELYFNHNKYGDGDLKGADSVNGAITYNLEITKLHFTSEAAEPCCKKCDFCFKLRCKDCIDDKCEGQDSCGVTCCLNFYGDEATTKIEFIAGVGLDGKADKSKDKIIHHNPQVVAKVGGAAISANGTVTMNNYSLLFYKFPTSRIEGEGKKAKEIEIDYMDYDYIDIFFTLSEPFNSAETLALPGTHDRFKVQMRDYKGDDEYTFAGGSYKDFGSVAVPESPHRIQTWGDNGTGGFAIRMNSWDVDGSPTKGSGECYEKVDIKITKIEFTKGTRYEVEFYSPMTPSNNNLPKLKVLSGNGLASRLPKLTHNGWNFLGWVNDWDPDTNQPTVAALDIGDSTPITKNTRLFAKWAFLPPPTSLTITIDGTSVIAPVTAEKGSFTYLPTGKGIRYTLTEAEYGNSYPIFEINFAGTDRLSDFAELKYTIKGVNNGYKGVKLFAKASTFSGDVNNASGIKFFTETVGSGTTGYQIQGQSYTRTITIDTTAVGALDSNAKIFIAIEHGGAKNDVWEISDITLTK